MPHSLKFLLKRLTHVRERTHIPLTERKHYKHQRSSSVWQKLQMQLPQKAGLCPKLKRSGPIIKLEAIKCIALDRQSVCLPQLGERGHQSSSPLVRTCQGSSGNPSWVAPFLWMLLRAQIQHRGLEARLRASICHWSRSLSSFQFLCICIGLHVFPSSLFFRNPKVCLESGVCLFCVHTVFINEAPGWEQ